MSLPPPCPLTSQATNIEFMNLYGNPALGMDEAGYYLTTLSVAANFIESRLADEELKKPNQSVVDGVDL